MALAIVLITSGCVTKPPVRKPIEVIRPSEPTEVEHPSEAKEKSTSTEKKESAPRAKARKMETSGSIKVGLRVDVEKFTVTCDGDVAVEQLDSKKKKTVSSGELRFSADGKEVLLDGQSMGHKVLLQPEDGHYLGLLNSNHYRGKFLVVANDSLLVLINEVNIDDYLQGVLTREVVVTWPLESLKSQAVASRTYLASHLGRHADKGFDLCSDVHCQVYGGMTKEHPQCNRAIDETHGEILTYQGKAIAAYFHSNCGGMTEQVAPVWGLTNTPYLPRKKCTFGTEDPRYHWKMTYHPEQMLTLLKKKTRVTGTTLKSFRVKKKSLSGRAQTVTVTTDNGNFNLSANEFRIALDPEKIRSTLWTDVIKKNGAYEFHGKGWGHGVGMCQWGAKGQAEQGRRYEEILKFYYPNTKLKVWTR